MMNAAKIFGAVGMVMVLSGCPIFFDSDDAEPVPDCGWGCADECTVNSDCPEGYWCNDGSCDATWFCDWDSSCPPDYTCDERDTCVPDPDGEPDPVSCDEDADCEAGYCGDDGFCVDSGTCEGDEDCSTFGPGLMCDDRGVCVVDEGPCPDGQCGCTSDDECVDGNLCINSRCTDLSTICVFDFECGDGACIDNDCHASCAAADATCPVGQGCVDDICQDLTAGADGCVFNEDCGDTGFRCVNATCHPTCTDHEQCGDGETCRSGVCRADSDPVRTCTAGGDDCAEGMICLRGICRMPCANDINCVDDTMTTCGPDGFCLFDEELAPPECQRASDCGDDGLCLNGSCL